MGAPLFAIVGAWWPVSWCWMFSRPDAVSGSQLWRQPSGQWTAGLGAQRAHLPSLSKHCKLREARPGTEWANQRPEERLVTNQRQLSYIAQCYISYRTNIDRTRIKYLHNLLNYYWMNFPFPGMSISVYSIGHDGDDGQVYYIVEWNHLSFFLSCIFYPCLNATKNAGALSVLSQRSPYSCSVIEFAPNTKLIDKTRIN